MNDTPKNEDDEKPAIPQDFNPTLFDLIDWVFFAGAPIGEPEEESEEGEADENKARGDGP